MTSFQRFRRYQQRFCKFIYSFYCLQNQHTVEQINRGFREEFYVELSENSIGGVCGKFIKFLQKYNPTVHALHCMDQFR